MNKDQIIEIVENLNALDSDDPNKPNHYIEVHDDNLVQSVHVGGSRGASCWDDAPSVPYRYEDVQEFDLLECLLEKVCPSITFLQFQRLRSVVTEEDEDDYHDYYGNYSTYRKLRLNMDDFIESLKGMGYE